MPAPLNNRYWLKRSKHGRNKIFESPEILWESAVEYFNHCEDNPITQQNWVGKDGEEVLRKLNRPFTLSGLCVFLDCDEKTLRSYGTNDSNKDFFPVYTRIEQTIRTQKFDGAAVGIFNANIIARDLGLRDKQETEIVGKDGGPITITLNLNK